MATKSIPINGDVLRWALDEAGMDTRRLAKEVAAEPADIEAWINGDSKPNASRFKLLADALERPPSFFLRKHPPQQSQAIVSLRVPFGNKGHRELTPEERVEVRRALRIQKIAKWSVQNSYDVSGPEVPSLSSSPEQSAEVVERWLSWDRQEHYRRRTSKSAVMKLLRRRIESTGILVLQYSLDKAIRGFSNYDADVPLIAFNSKSYVSSARSYTILHELAHLLFREQAVCGSSDDAHERWCDEFAAAFLMPRVDLLNYVTRSLGLVNVGPDDIVTVANVSDYFKASYQSVALRLWNLNLAPFSLYTAVRSAGSKIEIEEGFARGGAKTPELRMRQFGVTYPRLLIDACRSQRLSQSDLRTYLDVNGEQLAVLAQLVAEAE
jgi:Zn-dependent peptidase ImmA (M78 family)